MEIQEYQVNLDLPPSERWAFLAHCAGNVDELLGCYLRDFSGAEDIFNTIPSVKHQIVSSEYLQEIESIASFSNFTPDQVLIANLY